MIKKITILFMLLICSLSISQNSILNTGQWHQFSIKKTGVHKIDKNFLESLGINTNAIDPRNIKIYGNGGNMLPELCSEIIYNDPQENAIFINGESDGSFNESDYILFYAKDPNDWSVNPLTNTVSHNKNIYTDETHYFLTIGTSAGKRINEKAVNNQNATSIVSEFNDYTFYENDDVNLVSLGRLWFGENFSVVNNQNFSIPFPNLVANTDLKIKIAAAAQSSSASNMALSANNNTLNPISFSSINNSNLARHQSSSSIIQTNQSTINININYNNNGNPSARAYLDYIEISGKKKLIANESQFSFRSFDAANTSNIVEYQIENNQNIFQVWDVTDNLNPSFIRDSNTQDNLFSFKENGGELKEYILINSTDFYTPTIPSNKTIANQNLKALIDTQYLIITTSALANQAKRLSDYHSQNSNLTTEIVVLDKIYNEFSSGNKDITAIRNFIKYLFDNSSENKKLKYVCFFGDTSYDYKNRITDNNNIVPAFYSEESFDATFSYVTDDYFAMIDETDGNMHSSDDIDIATGRIPVSTTSEAKIIVDKILSYYSSSSFGNWKNTLTFVADDIDQDSDRELQSNLEKVTDSIKKYQPKFNINKIYADAYQQDVSAGGERYPDVKLAITNSIEKGTLVLDYFGHGGEDGLSDERILTLDQIKSFSNYNTLPLFITVTCEFSRFDNPLRDTGGEQLILNQNGGVASMISTTRAITINQGELFNQNLAKHIFSFDNNDDSIAENVMKTKNETSTSQRFFIYYFGDPAMKLGIPTPKISITKVNNVAIDQTIDILKALSKITLTGEVTDDNNNLQSDFNGTLYATIYDKESDRETLDNDNFGIINTFDIQESKIFNGKASVKNGTFEFSFVVPKDIKSAYGNGKISLYAENKTIEKGGANFDIIVGGIDENAAEDNIGPEIEAYLNDESFVEGGNVNSSPNLIIKLFDNSGINTSTSAVDHDIIAVLDGNQYEPYILNDYYQTEIDDYTKGEVNFSLRDLSTGTHTLKIKAWDTYNNSSEITFTFTVVDDSILSISNVLNYPNPFVNYTEFWFTHNKPNIPLNVQIQIFTVSGKLIKTINQSIQTTGNLSRDINWNGLDDFGNKIGKGVYVYKLKINSESENLSFEKYEKLVIL